jgi:hypothetical protein
MVIIIQNDYQFENMLKYIFLILIFGINISES